MFIVYYSIEGGNGLLIQPMVNECQTMESNSIDDKKWYEFNIFDTIIVTTTATAAQLIDFYPQIDFIDKYRSFR